MLAMIVPLEPKEFIPCGQQVYSLHPGILCLHIQQNNASKSLLGTLSEVTLDDKPKSEESWTLRTHNEVEEELYFSGHTVIWSRGQVLLKSFTVDSLVKQAVWCDFVVNSEDPYQFNLPRTKSQDCTTIEGVAVVTNTTLHVYTKQGESYDTALPFQVRHLWNFTFGLLFERKKPQPILSSQSISNVSQHVSEDDLTTIFCLQHPLREFSPIITKSQGNVRYMNRAQDSVVYCEDDFVMTCDERQGLHTVWRARNVSSDDVNVLQAARVQPNQVNSSICHMSMSSPGVSPFRNSYRGSPAGGYSSTSAFMGNSNLGGGPITKTPHTNRNPSLAHLSYTPHSSKAFSPSAGSLLHQSYTFSPLRHSPHLTRSPCTPLSHESLCLNNSVRETAEPLRPELCFDHMWTETLTSTREGLSTGRATKVFRTKDLCGQTYLAYHLDSLSQLRLVRYNSSNNQTHLIFGAVTQLQARDAASLEDLRMLAVLDLSGSITLYSGLLKVVKVNISGIPMSSISASHGLRTQSVPSTPQPISTPAHPSRPTSAMANLDEVSQLSPVPELAYSGDDISIMTGDEFAFSTSGFPSGLAGIPHVIGSALLVELTGGNHYRVEIPQLCSTELVQTCLKALQYMLPNDTYLSLAIKWYSSRHAPGALNGRRAEWSLFVECLLDFLGYSETRGLSFKPARAANSTELDVSASPVIAAKKARPTEQNDLESESWKYLLESKYECGYKGSADIKTEDFEDNLTLGPQSQSFSFQKRRSINSSLVGHSNLMTNQLLMSVFCALHLVYEEQKMSTLTWHNVSLMSSLLFRIASDLHQANFLQVYAVDNVPLLGKVLSGRLQDLSAGDCELDSKNPSFPAESNPSVFESLDELITTGSCKHPFPYIPDVTKRIEWIFNVFDCLFNHTPTPSITILSPLMKTNFSRGDHSSVSGKRLKDEGTPPTNRVLCYMVDVGIDTTEMLSWPPGVLLPIQESLNNSCISPDLSLPTAALKLLGRGDLVSQTLPDAGKWREAGLCPSTDPLRFAWTDQDDEAATSEETSEKDEIIAVLEKDDNEEETSSSPALDPTEDNVTRLLFPNDHRIADAYNLLNSAQPTKVVLKEAPSMDDRELMEQKETRLLQLLNRSLALCVGRGMLQYRTQLPSSVEAISFHELDLSGRDINVTLLLPLSTAEWRAIFELPCSTAHTHIILHPRRLQFGGRWGLFRPNYYYLFEALCSPNQKIIPFCDSTSLDVESINASVSLMSSNIDMPSELTDWPAFHNGVAAALSIQSDENKMSWVHLGEETSSDTSGTHRGTPIEHAGALFGLGLNHHLQELQTLNVHEYLQKSHEMTTIGLLLGLASDKCGSCDSATMRLLSVHISALLPDTSTSLDIPYRVQTAAVMAVGFLFLGSGQRLVAEVMLKEIDSSPVCETETSIEREAYSLSAGFALGMVTLGKGEKLQELSDLSISDKLFHLMTGKHKRTSITSRYSDTYSPTHSSHSNNFNQILEGDRVNTEVTCPGATVALALMFLKTNNMAVADWFIAADTISLLETVKPQHLMLRTMTRALILWDQILPSIDWIESHVPAVIQLHLDNSGLLRKNEPISDQSQVDEHTILQCHASIITGACIALGLRFAGSQEKTAFDTLLHYVQFFMSLSKKHLETIGQRLYETCLASSLTAMCLVVAGSGNLKALQICRHLHFSVENEVSYGMQMATHMAMGFLFLGGCRYTLETSNKGVAALLVSVFPTFPTKSFDNRYHLQAFRHMYVLATEKRLLVPIDVSTQRPCYALVSLSYVPTSQSNTVTVRTLAPCLLPETRFLQSIAVDDMRHLPIQICVKKQVDKVDQILNDGMYVQLRPGCLSYIQDPKGHCTYLSRTSKRTLSVSSKLKRTTHGGDLASKLFDLLENSLQNNDALGHMMSLLKDHCNHSNTFFQYLSLLQICHHIETELSADALSTWQIRLADHYLTSSSRQLSEDPSRELVLVITSQLNHYFDHFVAANKSLIEAVVCNRRIETHSRILTRSQCYHETEQSLLDVYPTSKLTQLACYLVYNSVSLRIGKGSTPSASPTKRKSRHKTDENITSALLRLKQLKGLGLPNSTCLQMWSLT